MAQRTITYSELGVSLGRTGASPGLRLGSDLAKLEEWLKEHALPPLTFLVVSKTTGRPSDQGSFGGVPFANYSSEEIERQQQACFDHIWDETRLKTIGVILQP